MTRGPAAHSRQILVLRNSIDPLQCNRQPLTNADYLGYYYYYYYYYWNVNVMHNLIYIVTFNANLINICIVAENSCFATTLNCILGYKQYLKMFKDNSPL